MIKSTSGPWECEYATEDCFVVNKKTGGQLSRNRQENQANARLIASAPDLLEACQMMSDCNGTTQWAMDQLSVPERNALTAIRSAIARATGKEPA